MERRLYFIVGDLAANGLVGAVTGLSAAGLVGESHFMPVAMVVGMLLGIGIATVVIPVFGPLFGLMEVQVPAMLTGMLVGMSIGMTASVRAVDATAAGMAGALIGIGTWLAIVLFDARLRARSDAWMS